ncbi:putative RNA methyltransferase pc1544 [Chlamydiales bacterium STE3]|nr:putative RNA methyltransferase pc1544 [Chlamydiales bacterium STE3]
MQQKKAQIVDVTITALSKEGNGTGFYGDLQQKIEIPFTYPEDQVTAQITKKKRQRREGRLLEIHHPSSKRIAPRCIHFGQCGGCRFQHISYEEQLLQKNKRIGDLFRPLLQDNTLLLPIVPCDSPWEYRNKMEFTFSSDKHGEQFLGLILAGTRGHVFNLTECHLTHPWFADTLKAVRSWWVESSLKAYHAPKNEGSLRTLTIREGMTSGDRMVMLTVSGNPDFALHKNQLQSFVAAINNSSTEIPISIFLRIQQAIKGEPTQFYEMHLGGPETIREELQIADKNLHFNVSPSSFFQPNTYQAQKIYQLAVEMSEVTKESIVYDLYCGTGTLGISFAPHCQKVIGVEISPESSLDARTNAKGNFLENIEIFTGSCAEVLHKMREEKALPAPNILLLDPPRAGLEQKALNEICALNSPAIIYISCNPESQARDVAFFLEQGYHLRKIQPVDQFPQTMHIENIILLKK